MKYDVIFGDEAHAEAVAAARYIAVNAGADTAIRWYDGLVEVIATLSDNPQRCPSAPEHYFVPDLELRQLLYGSYRIVFLLSEDQVQVLTIRHMAQR